MFKQNQHPEHHASDITSPRWTETLGTYTNTETNIWKREICERTKDDERDGQAGRLAQGQADEEVPVRRGRMRRQTGQMCHVAVPQGWPRTVHRARGGGFAASCHAGASSGITAGRRFAASAEELLQTCHVRVSGRFFFYYFLSVT